ncbi:alpha-beta hydrolase superfamily lysophospholipase [Bradyrhizobium sp. LM2.7]
MTTKLDVFIPAEGGISLHSWPFAPDRKGPHPAMTMAHGFGGSIHHGLEPFAVAFAEVGFFVLLHDHRGFGRSGGDTRNKNHEQKEDQYGISQ